MRHCGGHLPTVFSNGSGPCGAALRAPAKTPQGAARSALRQRHTHRSGLDARELCGTSRQGSCASATARVQSRATVCACQRNGGCCARQPRTAQERAGCEGAPGRDRYMHNRTQEHQRKERIAQAHLARHGAALAPARSAGARVPSDSFLDITARRLLRSRRRRQIRPQSAR